MRFLPIKLEYNLRSGCGGKHVCRPGGGPGPDTDAAVTVALGPRPPGPRGAGVCGRTALICGGGTGAAAHGARPRTVGVTSGRHLAAHDVSPGPLVGTEGGLTSRCQAERPSPPAGCMTVVQFCGWALQSALRALREYVYVNSPFTSSRTYSVWTTSWNFPFRHLGHTQGSAAERYSRPHAFRDHLGMAGGGRARRSSPAARWPHGAPHVDTPGQVGRAGRTGVGGAGGGVFDQVATMSGGWRTLIFYN